MSESEDSEGPDNNSGGIPNRDYSVETKKQIALAKYYGMDDEEWTLQEIADYLDITKRQVERYVYESDMAEEVEEKLADMQARTRMKLAMKLLNRLDDIEEMIEERKSVKEPAVASHKEVDVEGDVVMTRDGMSVGGEDTKQMNFTIPVPDHFTEVTELGREMESLMREWRQTVQEIEDLMGLEAPDKIEEERREISIEGRVFEGVDRDAFPDPGDDEVEVEGEMEQIEFEDK